MGGEAGAGYDSLAVWLGYSSLYTFFFYSNWGKGGREA